MTRQDTVEIVVRIKDDRGEYFTFKPFTKLQFESWGLERLRYEVKRLQDKADSEWNKRFPSVPAKDEHNKNCEQCGDCLSCHGEDPCRFGGDHA